MRAVVFSIILALAVAVPAASVIHATFSSVAHVLCESNESIPVLRNRNEVVSYLECTQP